MPLAIRSDNGPPFASPGVGGLSGWRCGGSSWVSGQSGSRRESRSKTGATSGYIARSTRRRQRLRPPVCRRNRSGSTRSAWSTTMSGGTRRWDSRRRLRRTGPSPRPYPDRLADPQYGAEVAVAPRAQQRLDLSRRCGEASRCRSRTNRECSRCLGVSRLTLKRPRCNLSLAQLGRARTSPAAVPKACPAPIA